VPKGYGNDVPILTPTPMLFGFLLDTRYNGGAHD
jgi:hypothetical protein